MLATRRVAEYARHTTMTQRLLICYTANDFLSIEPETQATPTDHKNRSNLYQGAVFPGAQSATLQGTSTRVDLFPRHYANHPHKSSGGVMPAHPLTLYTF